MPRPDSTPAFLFRKHSSELALNCAGVRYGYLNSAVVQSADPDNHHHVYSPSSGEPSTARVPIVLASRRRLGRHHRGLHLWLSNFSCMFCSASTSLSSRAVKNLIWHLSQVAKNGVLPRYLRTDSRRSSMMTVFH